MTVVFIQAISIDIYQDGAKGYSKGLFYLILTNFEFLALKKCNVLAFVCIWIFYKICRGLVIIEHNWDKRSNDIFIYNDIFDNKRIKGKWNFNIQKPLDYP